MRGPKIPTVMLTGLPEGNYRHEDVAELVRPYFPGWSLYSAYYDVVVLPLQRRVGLTDRTPPRGHTPACSLSR